LQAGDHSENSLISEIFVSTSEKIRLSFLLNAYAFRDFLIFPLNFQIFFLHCVLHPGIPSRPACKMAVINIRSHWQVLTRGEQVVWLFLIASGSQVQSEIDR
jgi:hypothetical protein